MGSVLGRWGNRLGRAAEDPVLVGVVALAVYGLHGTRGMVTRDLGTFLYGGEHFAHGTPPYVGIFNSVGPLADAVPGLAIWLGDHLGIDPVTAARMFFVVLSAGCVALVCMLARDAFASRVTGFVAAGVFLVFPVFLDLASDGPREKTTMLLALLGCLILLQRRQFVAAGVCAALATLTWQPALAPAMAAAATAVFLVARGHRWRAFLAFVGGGMVPTAIAVALFWLTDALHAALGGFLVINVFDTRQPSPLLEPGPSTHLLWHAYGPSLLLVPVGIIGLAVLAVRDQDARICAAGGLGATGWSLAVLNGAPDLFVVLPFAAVGVAGLALAVARHLPARTGYAVLVTAVVGAVVVGGIESVVTRSDKLDVQEADVAGVLATEPSAAGVLSIDSPELLALSGRSNPTPYQLFTPTMQRYLHSALPGGMRGYAREVAALQPTFVAVGERFRGRWPDRLLTQDYRRVGRGPGWTWYLNRDVGAAAFDLARNANQAVVRGAHETRAPA
jgi:hypothetical protein